MAGAVLRYHTHYIVKTLEETAFQKLLQWLSDRKSSRLYKHSTDKSA